ncbi:MAG: DUF2344 domain-containing protein [Planctomycetes bacterium]|nr:DUF2344 domain-containing protein [Planctomycetota bacterium]
MGSSRLLFRFAKEGDGRYLSHRDLMRLFERALRRAGLPLRMSQGFNPHPKLSILAALPVGVEADDEALDVEFASELPAAHAFAQLAAQMPSRVRLLSAEALPEGARPRVESLVYEAELPEGCGIGAAEVERFLPRPALRAISIEGGRLRFELAASADRATPRAKDVLAELLGGKPAEAARVKVRRLKVNLAIAQR